MKKICCVIYISVFFCSASSHSQTFTSTVNNDQIIPSIKSAAEKNTNYNATVKIGNVVDDISLKKTSLKLKGFDKVVNITMILEAPEMSEDVSDQQYLAYKYDCWLALKSKSDLNYQIQGFVDVTYTYFEVLNCSATKYNNGNLVIFKDMASTELPIKIKSSGNLNKVFLDGKIRDVRPKDPRVM
jgi:hypothetical protein